MEHKDLENVDTCHDKGGNCNYPYCTVPDCYEDLKRDYKQSQKQ